MTSNIFDIAIVGVGVAGAFAAYKLSKEYPDAKILAIDWGRPPMKRRRQLEGFLGCLPNSDGKFYLNNLNNLNTILNKKTINKNVKYFDNILKNIDKFKVTKDVNPSKSILNLINQNNYEYELNDFIQLYPKHIHSISKIMSEEFENNSNIKFIYDEDVKTIMKNRNNFTIYIDNADYKAKKVLLATGRSGWKWATDIYKKFGIITDNKFAKFGVRVQIEQKLIKNFNNSCLSLKKDNIEIGPFQNNGKSIQEDLGELAIISYRSNEPRYQTAFTSFELMGNIETNNKGIEEAERICSLIYLICDDRADTKEKVSTVISKKSKLHMFKEYNFLAPALEDLDKVVPNLINKGKVIFPTFKPIPPKINISSNLETEIKDLYVVGDNVGFSGLYGAAVGGLAAADFLIK